MLKKYTNTYNYIILRINSLMYLIIPLASIFNVLILLKKKNIIIINIFTLNFVHNHPPKKKNHYIYKYERRRRTQPND